MIACIWAQDEQGLIGKDNTLPWHLPNDLQHFKKTTINQAVVMGRKTFDGMKQKPLKDRLNIVMTKDQSYTHPDVQIIYDKQEILELAKHYDGTIFIIGGRQIFEQFLDEADLLYRTVLHQTFAGDIYMPPIDYAKWQLQESKEGSIDEKNTIPHTFECYVRKAI